MTLSFSVFHLVKKIQRNVLIEGKRFTILEDVGAGPFRGVIIRPKFWREITAWYNRGQWHNLSYWSVVATGTGDRKELGVNVGYTELGEPLDACVMFWEPEIVTTQVVWKGKNEPYLSNTETYQAATGRFVSKNDTVLTIKLNTFQVSSFCCFVAPFLFCSYEGCVKVWRNVT